MLPSGIAIEWRWVAEEALRAKEALLNDALDSLTANLAILDADGVITLVNAAWRRSAGRHLDGLPLPRLSHSANR